MINGIVLYRPKAHVLLIEDQDHLNELLRNDDIDSELVENTEESKQSYFDSYFVERLTDLIGFDKEKLIKAAKKKTASKVEAQEPVAAS